MWEALKRFFPRDEKIQHREPQAKLTLLCLSGSMQTSYANKGLTT